MTELTYNEEKLLKDIVAKKINNAEHNDYFNRSCFQGIANFNIAFRGLIAKGYFVQKVKKINNVETTVFARCKNVN